MLIIRVASSQHNILREGKERQNREKDLVSLAWKIKELSQLNEDGRTIHTMIGVLTTKLTGQWRWIEDNTPS